MKQSVRVVAELLPHILFFALIALQFLEGYYERKGTLSFVAALCALELIHLLRRNKPGNPGLFLLLFGFLALWHLYANNFAAHKSGLLPPPSYVTNVIYEDRVLILKGIVSSAGRLGGAFVTALVLGMSAGLVCGTVKRLQTAIMPLSEAIAAVPALVYAPYTIALFGNFQTSAWLIITLGLFFPILFHTVHIVNTVPKILIDNTRALNLSFVTRVVRVLLPYSLPSLFNTVSSQVANAFILLIGAELMGMTVGAGWYVKYYSDMMNYPRVIAGFVVMMVFVATINLGLAVVRKQLLKWEAI